MKNKQKRRCLVFVVHGALFLTSAVAAGEVSSLAHEVGDHTVERRALEVEGLAGLTHALLARAQASEVFRGPRHHVGTELQPYVHAHTSAKINKRVRV